MLWWIWLLTGIPQKTSKQIRMMNCIYQPLIFRKVFLFGRRWLCFLRFRRRRRGGFIFLPLKEVLVQQHRQCGHHPLILQLPAQPTNDCVTRTAVLFLTETNISHHQDENKSLGKALTCQAGKGFSWAAPAVLCSWDLTRAHGSEDRSPASGKGRASQRGSLSISLLGN